VSEGARKGTEKGAGGVSEGALSMGAVVFLTGLSGAGKSTIAEALATALREAGTEVSIVDGDALRREAHADLGYDAASREANIRRAAELAARFAADGQIVISALIAPFERSRREARRIIEAVALFLLVYVSTPLDVAEARDPKGLYRRARAGEIADFTGIDSPYESPPDADLVLDTSVTPVPESVLRIRSLLEHRLNEG